jgi:hypothetical protein
MSGGEMSHYYKGPHSAKAWLAFVVFCFVLILVEHSFLGVVIGFIGFLGVSFVIFKLIGGEGGFFR